MIHKHHIKANLTLVIAALLLLMLPNAISGENNNAGDLNVEGGTSGNEWTYNSDENKLTFNTSGTYVVIGNGQETNEEINVSANFEGTITIRNINAKKICLDKTVKLTLFIDGTNTLREGLRFDNPEEGSYLIIDSKTNGSLTARGNEYESGIGGGGWQNGGNITIKGGNITAIGGEWAPGIGCGYDDEKEARNITISGGTVTAIGTGYRSFNGIGHGYFGGSTNNIVITGGSVRTAGFGTDPTDGKGNKVYLTKIEKISDTNASITIDDKTTFKLVGNHDDEDKAFYLYLTGEDHTLKINDTSYSLIWRENEKTFLYPYCNLFNNDLNISVEGDDTSNLKYDPNNKIHYILKDGTYTITNNKTEANERIYIDNNAKATLILNGVNIKREDEVISLGENTNASLIFNGENNIETSGNNVAAITTTSENSSLTFDSDTNGILNVTASSGIAIGSIWNTYNITFNGGTINAKGCEDRKSDIGIGSTIAAGNYYAKNIVINDGTVNCITSGLGSSNIGNKWFSKQCQITINGGTVTAPVIGGSISGENFDKAITSVTINGGSVKGTIMTAIDDNNKYDNAYDKNGNKVYLVKIDNLSGINKVKVDNSLEYTRDGDHPNNDGAFYLYLTGEDHTISVNNKVFCYAKWNKEGQKFELVLALPLVTFDTKYANSIVVNELENQEIYGEAEYSLDKENWQTSNIIEGLSVDTEYIIYARYKGLNNYLESGIGSVTVRTKKDGKTLINSKKPTNLVGIYEQKLSDISLLKDWAWKNKNTMLSIGKNKYSAIFDVTSYKNEYDFSNVVKEDILAYNSKDNYVEVLLAVDVSKAESSLSITNDINKTYDGKVVIPTIKKTGSCNEVTFTWFLKNDDVWDKLDEAPIDVGVYKVTVSVKEDDKYNGKEIEKNFEIYKAIPNIPSLNTFTIIQGNRLSSINLPTCFSWIDTSIKADEVGKHIFKAVYTPVDTKNYKNVELDVLVNVVEAEKEIVEESNQIEDKVVSQKPVIKPADKAETAKEEKTGNKIDNEIIDNDDKKVEEKEIISSIDSLEDVSEDKNVLPLIICAIIVLVGIVVILIIKHRK